MYYGTLSQTLWLIPVPDDLERAYEEYLYGSLLATALWQWTGCKNGESGPKMVGRLNFDWLVVLTVE